MYKTLNNSIAEHIVLCAFRGQHRFCAYSLYNHYKANTFTEVAFHRLFQIVLIGLDDYIRMTTDESIDYCVRDFIYRFITFKQ